MQRAGQDPEGVAPPRRNAPQPRRPPKREPFRIGQFLREVRSELRQVAWPNRAEVVNYTTVTLVTLLSLMVLIFVLNYAFAHGVLWLFNS
ncbi:MAG: preprotein translocase subunit SecE [Acidimicrobiales bacterium]|jgi:preprotein translocase subunit SecE